MTKKSVDFFNDGSRPLFLSAPERENFFIYYHRRSKKYRIILLSRYSSRSCFISIPIQLMNQLRFYFSNLSPSTLDMDRRLQKPRSKFRFGRRLSGCGTTSTYDDSDSSTIASLDRKRFVSFSRETPTVRYIPRRTLEDNLDQFYDDYDIQAFRQELIEEKRAKDRPSIASWENAKKTLEQQQQQRTKDGSDDPKAMPQKSRNLSNLERLKQKSPNHWKQKNPADEDDHQFLVGGA